MIDDNKKMIIESTEKKSKKELAELDKVELQQYLFQATDALLTDKGTDQQLDRRNEIIELQSGKKIHLFESERFIVGKAMQHPTQFMLDYYSELYRVLGFTSDPKLYYKPKIIADITNELVYGRFPKEIVNSINIINPYTGYCIRSYKNYQFLSIEALGKLKEYINDVINSCGECNSYYELRKLMFERYGIPYQINLFN